MRIKIQSDWIAGLYVYQIVFELSGYGSHKSLMTTLFIQLIKCYTDTPWNINSFFFFFYSASLQYIFRSHAQSIIENETDLSAHAVYKRLLHKTNTVQLSLQPYPAGYESFFHIHCVCHLHCTALSTSLIFLIELWLYCIWYNNMVSI